MTLSITHTFQSTVTEDTPSGVPDGLVGPTEWNATHTISGGALSVIGRSANSAGAAADIATTASSAAVLRESGGTIGWGTVTAGAIVGADLTKADDTNVTLTLTGTPTGALLKATLVTVGWTGTLAAARLNANVVQAVTNDTNITGSIATQTVTLGWTGTLAVSRGGTGGGSASGTLLDNISGFASTGLLARTASGTYAFRTLTAPAAGITVTTGDGVSGNPTLVLANDLSAVEGLASNGIAVRTATDTWTVRTITGTANRLTVTNGDGVSGAPTLDVSTSYVGQATITTLGTITTGTWQGTAVAGGFGGTGIASYAVGDLLYASASTTLSKLADVATGNALISGGVTTAPSWGKIALTTHVSGVLPEANGGTNQSTYTTGDILYASASNTLSKLADVATGNALISGGVTTAPAWGKIALTTHVSGTLPVANGGTGQTTEAAAIGGLISALTADASPDATADYVGTYDASAATGKKVLLTSFVREKLTANRTYYVRTDGSDSNTGLANTAGGAFLTIQKAIDVIAGIDLTSYSVTVQIATGTYTGLVTPKSYVGAGPVYIIGDEVTLSNVYIDVSSSAANSCISADTVYGKYSLRGLKLKAGSSGVCISANNGSVLEYQNILFNGSSFNVLSNNASSVTATGNSEIAASSAYHIVADIAGTITHNSRTLTLTGTPAWSAFANVGHNAGLYFYNNTISGSGTGVRYTIGTGGWIETVGGGASALPGNSAGSGGTTTGGGWYA